MPKARITNDFYVYVLFDWLGTPRYIGMGRGRRWTDHEQTVDKHNPMKRAFIARTLHEIGEIPKDKIVEHLTRPEAADIERLFIRAIGRRPQGPLTNLTDGGDGGDFGAAIRKTKANWSPEMRRHVAETARERTLEYWKSLSPEDQEARREISRRNQREAVRKLAENPDLKTRTAAAIKAGHARRTPEQKAETSQKVRETYDSEQQSEVTREWHANMSPEQRAARGRSISIALSGRSFPGDRAKVSEAVAKLWRDPEYRASQVAKRLENPSGRGKIWITDGTRSRRILPNDPIPMGWRRGKTYRGSGSRALSPPTLANPDQHPGLPPVPPAYREEPGPND